MKQLSQTIREKYHKQLCNAANEQETDAVLRSIAHFVGRGYLIDTTVYTRADLETIAKRAILTPRTRLLTTARFTK